MNRTPVPPLPDDALAGLPLTHATDPAWVDAALTDLDALLADHAHCEEKAASSALRLLARYPEVPGLWRRLLALAHEELRHFRAVVEKIEARGGKLTRPLPDQYAGAIRALSCTLPHGLGELGDQLLACAFIEARSCERLRLLADALGNGGPDGSERMSGFYRQLADAEGRHWELFRDLAITVAGADAVARRITQLAAAEGELAASLPLGPRIH